LIFHLRATARTDEQCLSEPLGHTKMRDKHYETLRYETRRFRIGLKAALGK
jgi:hypothetical protein